MDIQIAAVRPQAPPGTPPFHTWNFQDGRPWAQFHREGGGYLLRFPGLADFLVSPDGSEVRCWPAPEVSRATVEHLYLNQILPLALSRQGRLVLHGSAVEIHGGAAAFVGESGRGKSTLAAGFATAGHPFLTDDGLLLEPFGADYLVLPSHPSIRLWEDSEAALAGGAPKAPPVDFTPKSRLLAGEGIPFCGQPRRLRRLYFLGEGGGDVAFEPMAPAATVIELVKHSFLLDIEAHELLAAHFDELSRLASRPIFYRLDYPRRYEDLPSVRRAIIEHIQQEAEAA